MLFPDVPQGRQALLLVGEAQQRAGVALCELILPQKGRSGLREPQKAQLVGHSGLRLAQLGRRLLL